MKKLLISIFGALLSMTAQAIDAPLADSISVYGNHLAQLTQLVEIALRNPSDTDYEGRLYLLVCNKSNGSVTPCCDTLVTVKAQNACLLWLKCSLPEGDLELRLSADANGQQPLRTCDVTILPLRKLDFKTTFSLDMMMIEGKQVLYGSRIRGWVRVQNNDDAYYGANGGTADDDGLVLWLEDSDTGERLYTKHIADELRADWHIDTDFDYDAVFRDGAHYALKAGYGMPYGLEAIDSLCFTTTSGFGTYWTADGQVLPLDYNEATTGLGDEQSTLHIPAEAVAADLRGQYAYDKPYVIDASQANPNCLYYLDPQANIPEGLDESYNIVQGLEATNIKLNEGYDYYCPLAFHTQFVSYLMTLSYDDEAAEMCGRGYSNTIVLPFRPTHALLYDINDGTEMLHSDMIQVLRYYGTHADTLTLERCEIADMQPYAPYILGVYIGSSLLFVGENVDIPMTQEAIIRDNLFNFVGTTVARQLTNSSYIYEPETNSFRRCLADSRVASFQAYMDAVSDASMNTLSISDATWGPKGNPNNATIPTVIKSIKETSNNTATIYDLTGRQIRQPQLVERPLSKGVYIIGGHKVIVK